MGYDTALVIISDAATELGLGAVSDAYGSTDNDIIRLRALLKSKGRELLKIRDWTGLRQSWLFTTVANQGRYALPLDFARVVAQTAWNRTSRLPLGGPLTPKEFEALKGTVGGVVSNIFFEVLQGQFQAYPDTTTSASFTIAYEYMPSHWVIPSGTATSSGTWQAGVVYSAAAVVQSGGRLYTTAAGGTSGNVNPTGTVGTISDGGVNWTYTSVATADAPAANGDTILLDSRLVSRALKVAWLQSTGFDSTAAVMDYQRALADAESTDSQGRELRVGGPRGIPLLGAGNIPQTGFGS